MADCSRAHRQDIDLLIIGKNLKEHFFHVIACVAALSVVFFLASFLMVERFKSEATLFPADDTSDVMSGVVGQVGGLASLAGIQLSQLSGNRAALGLELLKSRVFLVDFIRRHGLAVPLLAAKSWDRESGVLDVDSDIYDVESKTWVRAVRPPKQKEPSDLELYEIFVEDVLKVTNNTKTGFVRVEVSFLSPKLAAEWLTFLIADLNDYMRASDVAEARKSIEYLNAQIEKTSIAEMQEIFYELIERQTKIIMLAKVRDEYAFEVIDPPFVPEERVWPKRLFIAIFGGLIGGVVAIIYFAIRGHRQGFD